MRKLMAMATSNKSCASILKSNPKKKTLYKNEVKQNLKHIALQHKQRKNIKTRKSKNEIEMTHTE